MKNSPIMILHSLRFNKQRLKLVLNHLRVNVYSVSYNKEILLYPEFPSELA